MKVLKIIESEESLKFVFLCLSVSSECLGSQQTILAQLCVSNKSAGDDVDLVSLLYWPLQQLHQYGRVLLKLAACYDVVRVKHSLITLLFSLKHSFTSCSSLFHFLSTLCISHH